MRLNPWAIGPALAGCALIAVTSCTTDEPQTEAGLSPTISAATAAASAYDIVKVPAMTIDGNLNDWANIATISIADDPNNGRGALNNSAKVKLAWDDTYLYAAYDVTDTELLASQTTRDQPDIYKDDAVEFYIDPQGNGSADSSMMSTDYHFLANVRETLGDLKGTGTGSQDESFNAASFLAKAVVNGTLNATGTDVGYVIEMRISWSDLGVTPGAGSSMRLDVAVEDRDTSNTTTEEFDWTGLTTSWNNPSAWKDVQLVDPPPPVSAYDIVKVGSTTMTVDGDLSDWAGIAAISMADNSGRTGGVDNTAKMKFAWDPTYLYYAYDVTDTELLAAQTARDADSIYTDDEVELYIDPERDGWTRTKMTATDYQFLANVRESLGDYKGNGVGGKDAGYNATSFLAKAATTGTLNASGTDIGYKVEARITWTDLGVSPADGKFMRIDAGVGDKDTQNTQTEEFDWAGLTASWNNPSAWKDVKLVVDATAPAAPTNLALTVASSSQIDVSWAASTSADVAKYKIYRATSGTPTLYKIVPGSPYQDTGLTPGTTYTYQISAVDAAGNESARTPSSSATTSGTSDSTGVPFGPSGLYPSSSGPPVDSGFTGSIDNTSPSSIVTMLNNWRTRGHKGFLKLTPGYTPYVDNPNTINARFNMGNWKAAMDAYNTPAITQAVADAVRDGILLGHSLIDEPNRTTRMSTCGTTVLSTCNHPWGPEGFMTKATLDEMATYSRGIFPTLPNGAAVKHPWRIQGYTTDDKLHQNADEHYQVLDFIISQTWRTDFAPFNATQAQRIAKAEAFRDGALGVAAEDHIQMVLSMNLYSGAGDPVTTGCTRAPSGDTCMMSRAEIEDYGGVFVRAASALSMWQYHDAIWATTNASPGGSRRAGMNTVLGVAATATRKGFRRW
jgi:cellulose/xylan binding protein with CBM9 domain/fibronectin type III domain protein